MKPSAEFDLNLWNLTHHSASRQKWYQAAFQHNLDMLHAHFCPSFVHPPLNGTNVKPEKQEESTNEKEHKAFENGEIFNPKSSPFPSPSLPSVDVVHLFACGYEKDNRRFVSHAVLEQLLSWGGRLDSPDIYGWLPINYACYFGLPQTLDVLLEAGSPVQNPYGPQPLDSALTSVAQSPRSASETCARLLLFHGADPNRGLSSDPQWGGVTWLVWALMNERFDWAALLCNKGVSPLNEKEIRLLILRAPPKALAWAESAGIKILSFLPTSHHAYHMVHEASVMRQKNHLTQELSQAPAALIRHLKSSCFGEENDESEEGEGTTKARKI